MPLRHDIGYYLEHKNTYRALAINVSKCVVFVCTRRPLELHIANVVACLDDDPSMQMYLETASGLA